MQILRRLFVGFCATILLFALIGTAWSHIAAATILKRDTVKSWLSESNFYDNASQAVLEMANKSTKEGEQEQGGVPLDDPKIQAIAKSAFTPAFLKENIEKVLDGTYAWLEGRADKPEFSVDLAPAKQKLAEGLAGYAVERGASLPVCTPEQMAALTGDIDILSASCLPPGTDLNTLAADLQRQLLNDQQFMGDTSLSGDDITVTDNGQEVTLDNAPSFKYVQRAFKLAAMSPYLFAIAAILSALVIVFLSGNKLAGLRRTGVIFITAGVIVGLSYILINRGSNWLDQQAAELAGETNAAQSIASGMVQAVYNDIGSLLLWYAIGFIVIGIAGIVTARMLGRKSSGGPKVDSGTEPKPPVDDSPKPEPAKSTVNRPESPKPPRKIQL